MRNSTLLALFLAVVAPLAAQTGFPFQDESLRYSINWPSGLSLGDASFSARHTATGWNFDSSLTAGVPGFSIADKYQSVVSADLCSVSLDRTISHGNKKTQEKTTFDQQKGSAHRVTVVPKDGGQSDFDIAACAHDALSFFYFTRREMGQGRMPPAQKIYLGSAYSARVEYTGAMTIPVADKPTVTDHVVAYLKGPKSDFNFEIFFARDAARTPLLIRVPLSMGTFSMELVR
ncbi:MAG TPA: DUF3108 domain-containing protein [Bryobacteraceae bacterium]|nr:DUF3108 domain-containing protein [Bryobacteraceae bacterium]